MICPHCAEEIKDDAKKCKHCGEWLFDKEVAQIQPDKPDNSQVKKYEGILIQDNPGKFKSTRIKNVFAKSDEEARIMFSSVEGFSLNDTPLRSVSGQGKFSCPNCKGTFTTSDKKIGCAIMVIIFISLGLGLIMIPFLPNHCECELCGFKWKA